nr:hypothetical protein Iba_chr14dCG8030 [Ipomoea batatas]
MYGRRPPRPTSIPAKGSTALALKSILVPRQQPRIPVQGPCGLLLFKKRKKRMIPRKYIVKVDEQYEQFMKPVVPQVRMAQKPTFSKPLIRYSILTKKSERVKKVGHRYPPHQFIPRRFYFHLSSWPSDPNRIINSQTAPDQE